MRAKKSLGQNFLQDSSVVERIIDALDPGPDDTVIEIGPGQGALTTRLLESTGKVIAIEFDRDLIAPLRVQVHNATNLSIINEDALSANFGEMLDANDPVRTKLVANLPYNISTPILQRLFDQRQLFSTIVLMFQREVVERITAQPGNSDRGFLSVLVENAFETEHLFDVPPTAFRPVPKVSSAAVRLTPKSSTVENETLFRELLSRAFAQKRKTLLNNLKANLDNAQAVLNDVGIDGTRRAETLTLDEWAKLTAVLKVKRPGS